MEVMLGSPELEPTAAEAGPRMEARLSCVAIRDLPAGHVLTEADIVFRRPATGLRPAQVGLILGRALGRATKLGEAFTLDHLA
jgi:sialic acid synthase SpsE